MSRVMLFVAVAIIAGTAPTAWADHADLDTQADRALAAGIDWLARQQSEDGGWHSTTYGQMRGGVGNTALAVYAIATSPGQLRQPHKEELARAFAFLRRKLLAPNSVEQVDFPNYANALTIVALRPTSNPDAAFQQDLQRRLLAAQQSDGGWGNLTDDPSNISVTRFALEALRDSLLFDANAKRWAISFVESCQNFGSSNVNDGGMAFMPDVANALNKAGWEAGDERTNTRSYGTATADGLLALRACGVYEADPRIIAASAWLERHRNVDRIPGFEASPRDVPSTRDGLQFYYLAALARVAVAPGSPLADRRSAIRERLIALQQEDGSWRNPNTLMKEDDPLIATSLAIAALATLADDAPPADRPATSASRP